MPVVDQRTVLFLPPERVEPQAMRQIENTASLPFIFRHVAVMPDCHYGRGATVGTVLATKGALIPAAVGVDIGCGMTAVRTPLRLADLPDAGALRRGIERRIPVSAGRVNRQLTASADARVKALEAEAGRDYDALDRSWRLALGTLGGGNHFIELATDDQGRVWATLHSGSRGVGHRIGALHIRRAQTRTAAEGVTLPDRDLSYLREGTPEFEEYLRDLRWAQEYARLNREEMMDRVMLELSHAAQGPDGRPDALEQQRISCHHNFAQRERHFGEEVWITRKGAIEARPGMWAMIPGSMGTRSYIVTGLGHPLAFCSAPHGAGRRMSRSQARRQFTMRDLESAMTGIEFRHAPVLIDEIPAAYKDIDEVMAHAHELVAIRFTLRQFVNVKGD